MSGSSQGGYGNPSTPMAALTSRSVRTLGDWSIFNRDSTGHFRRSVAGAIDSKISDAP